MYENLSLRQLVDEAIKVNDTAKAMVSHLLQNQRDLKSTYELQILTGKAMMLGGLISLKFHEDPSEDATKEHQRFTKALQGRSEIYE